MNAFPLILFVLTVCGETVAFLSDDDVAIPYAVPSTGGIENAILVQDANLNFTELTGKYGYQSEEHTVVTNDKYILKLFHIVGKGRCNGTKRTPPVVLEHGLLDSADTWLLAGPRAGLAYGLADACYDVWCASVRGDYYSRAHRTLDPDRDAKFWNFAFEEYGEIDLPAMIDYVIEKTHSEDVFYIGHSQGTSDFFIMTSTKKEYNGKIRLAILLAPIASMAHIKSVLLRLAAAGSPILHKALNLTGTRELYGRRQPTHELAAVVCTLVPETACSVPIMAIAGDPPGVISRRTLQLVGSHFFNGCSVKNFIHFAQNVKSGRFARYDYGHAQNRKLYGSRLPPEFDLSQVSAPVVLVVAPSDRLSVIADVDKIYSTLPNVLEYYIVPNRAWGHVSLTWSDEIPVYLTPKITNYFDDYCDEE